jgi:hypothetical protein
LRIYWTAAVSRASDSRVATDLLVLPAAQFTRHGYHERAAIGKVPAAAWTIAIDPKGEVREAPRRRRLRQGRAPRVLDTRDPFYTGGSIRRGGPGPDSEYRDGLGVNLMVLDRDVRRLDDNPVGQVVELVAEGSRTGASLQEVGARLGPPVRIDSTRSSGRQGL